MRLTYKDENFKAYCSIATVPQLTQKLGKLEDCEEKYGIDLLLFLNALFNGFYYRSYNGKIKYLSSTEFWVWPGCFGYGWDYDPSFIYFKNYGKKEEGGWALTKKELK